MATWGGEMSVRCVTLAAMVAVAAQSAKAQITFGSVTIERLLPYCSAVEQIVDIPTTGDMVQPITDAGMDAAYCTGYLDGILAVVEHGPVKEVHICFPLGVNTKELAAIFVKYAENHPEWHHWPAVYGVTQALQDAFPCRGENAEWLGKKH